MPDSDVPVLVISEHNFPETATEIWPTPNAAPGLIQENRQYMLELRHILEPDLAELSIDGTQLQPLRSLGTSARWMWSPGFYSGRTDLLLTYADRSEALELTVDPDLYKLTRNDFDCMVREIMEDTFALFALSSFRTGIGRGTGTNVPPIARLEFIRSRIKEIEHTVRQINTNPVRILRSQPETTPIRRVRNFTGSDFVRSLQGNNVSPIIDNAVRQRMPQSVRDAFPQTVRKQTPSTGLNIREHQEIKATLASWAGWLEVVGGWINADSEKRGDNSSQSRVWMERCFNYARRLRRLLDLPLFEGVTQRAAVPSISSVYRRIPSYRDFFRLYQDMNLGIANVTGDFLNLPLSRTFDLYELWCFLRIVRVIAERYHSRVAGGFLSNFKPDTGELTIPAGNVEIQLDNHTLLAFQKEYKQYWKGLENRGSFSRTMIPDISMELAPDETPIQVIVLDAKYRIHNALNDAISSIHTYRDAIIEKLDKSGVDYRRIVIAAYLISPYIPTDTQGTDWQNVAMPGLLFHPRYRTTFQFGAITLRPGMSQAMVEQTIETVLRDAGVQLPPRNLDKDLLQGSLFSLESQT